MAANMLLFNTSLSSSSSSSSSTQTAHIASRINVPNRIGSVSLPNVQKLGFVQEKDDTLISSHVDIFNNFRSRNHIDKISSDQDPLVVPKLYAIMEAVADRVEMHSNIGEQRSNWNSLLLTSTNSLLLAAAMMAGIASLGVGAPAAALKLSSTVLYVGATGLLTIINKIQPSQLAEEQRNATRLFKQLQNQIRTIISIGKPTNFDVKEMMERVLALDKAYPLPLLGAMLEKFPDHVEPSVWWPERGRRQPKGCKGGFNGWNRKLEEEMRGIVSVVDRKDKEDYLRLGGKALKLNKFLAVTAPVLTGLAAVGSALMSSTAHCGWAVVLGVVGGALASVVNTLEHGGQVGMVFEMYRSNAGFFKLMEESIERNLKEEDVERRENGEVLEMKVSLQLGRSLSQLRELAAAAAENGEAIDQFASKLF